MIAKGFGLELFGPDLALEYLLKLVILLLSDKLQISVEDTVGLFTLFEHRLETFTFGQRFLHCFMVWDRPGEGHIEVDLMSSTDR